MKEFLNPIRIYKILLIGFIIKCLDIIRAHGARPLIHAAGDIEIYMRDAATGFVTRGWGATSGLPVYPTYKIHKAQN